MHRNLIVKDGIHTSFSHRCPAHRHLLILSAACPLEQRTSDLFDLIRYTATCECVDRMGICFN